VPGRSKIEFWEICIAAVLALIYGYSVFSDLSIPDTAFFVGDTWEYQSIALNFASGEGFKFGGLLPFEAYHFYSANPEYYDRFMDIGAAGGEPSTFRTPGYPFVLATIYRIFGVSPRTAIRI